ncbi:MAG: Maf family protein [Nitrospinaceae bacterium]
MQNSIKPVILASQSPRRIELLKQIIAEFQVIPSEVEELFESGRTPEENALAVARDKALSVAQRYPGHCVIGADTIVVLGEEIIGKPRDPQEAREILHRLAGREHRVITGICVIDAETLQETEDSTVRIKPLTDEEITRYVESGEPLDKAGAYAIQGDGAFMVASYEGSYSNIVGLPLEILRKLLRRTGHATA